MQMKILLLLFLLACTDSTKSNLIESVKNQNKKSFSYDFFYPEGEGMLDILSIKVENNVINSVVGAFPTTEFTFLTEEFPQDSLNKYLLFEIKSGMEKFTDEDFRATSRKAKELIGRGLKLNELSEIKFENLYVISADSVNLIINIDSNNHLNILGEIDSLGILNGKIIHVDKKDVYNYSFNVKLFPNY